ncbi:hypothetical protein AAKU52_002364 [Pedobacter sp. CG_S7]
MTLGFRWENANKQSIYFRLAQDNEKVLLNSLTNYLYIFYKTILSKIF